MRNKTGPGGAVGGIIPVWGERSRLLHGVTLGPF